MALDVLRECQITGPALPEPFVRFELEKELSRAKLLPKADDLKERWDVYRRKLRELAFQGGAVRVRNHVLDPLVERLGYAKLEDAAEVTTREGIEDGGWLMLSDNGQPRLRVWAASFDEDLDAPSKRGAAYRFSHTRIATRVLLASSERLGLLTNGTELRILISDPARPDSEIIIPLEHPWKRNREVPDSYRLLLALGSPAGVKFLPDLVEKARLQQTRVTKELRVQARQAIEGFLQEVLDHPDNQQRLAVHADRPVLAKELWREGLVIVYRLFFLLKLESTDDQVRSFGFASSSLWRNSYSPSIALAQYAQKVVSGEETGRLLEDGLLALFRMFSKGLECTELPIKPLGGALFGGATTPLLNDLRWGERAVATLLDKLLWTTPGRGATSRQRVHYGPLDVEDLGRVYEALLELEPGIASQPMCRLRRQKLEVVVPLAQGDKYRAATTTAETDTSEDAAEETDAEEQAGDEAPARGKKTKVEWIEEIHPGRFYLRVGLGRKSTGSHYTPHSFVRFLVQETIGPLVAERSPKEDPMPMRILELKVLDPAMGSGHFLVETCRFMGAKLYEACRLCDEMALALERKAEKEPDAARKQKHLANAQIMRGRVVELPDPDDELLKYLPSRAPEGVDSGLSQRKAEALCRRMVAVHCLYGVDKNPLAVELAKLTLWLESHAEGLPLTFLDHRLVVGDSLTGPFYQHLLTLPGSQQPVNDLFAQDLAKQFKRSLQDALLSARELEASVGITLSEIEAKQAAKRRYDSALFPFKIVAAAWTGGVMLGPDGCDDGAYAELIEHVAKTGQVPYLEKWPQLLQMIARGLGVNLPSEGSQPTAAENGGFLAWLSGTQQIPALPYDLTFPEVFFPGGDMATRQGFHAVLGNPPWDKIMPAAKEFFAQYDFDIVAAESKAERTSIEEALKVNPVVQQEFDRYWLSFEQLKRPLDLMYSWQNVAIDGQRSGAQPDFYRFFAERNFHLLAVRGHTGVVLPSAFHANEGATGIRRLYLEQMALQSCYSFENKRKLFEIHTSFKFATVVATKPGPTDAFSCAFYLYDDEWLFSDRKGRELRYTTEFVSRTSGKYLTFLEVQSATDVEVLSRCASSAEKTLESLLDQLNLCCGEELNKTRQSKRFHQITPQPREWDDTERAFSAGVLVFEGQHIWQFNASYAELGISATVSP